jgi:hypothetical protein
VIVYDGTAPAEVRVSGPGPYVPIQFGRVPRVGVLPERAFRTATSTTNTSSSSAPTPRRSSVGPSPSSTPTPAA